MRRNLNRDNMADLSQRYPDLQATADMFPGGEFPESLEHQDWRVCWRGGGFNNNYQEFFVPGKYYRVPGFLATSFEQKVSMKFLALKLDGDNPATLWIILVDGKGTTDPMCHCRHARFVQKSHLHGDRVFLFSP